VRQVDYLQELQLQDFFKTFTMFVNLHFIKLIIVAHFVTTHNLTKFLDHLLMQAGGCQNSHNKLLGIANDMGLTL
jgi:hypothetical protein